MLKGEKRVGWVEEGRYGPIAQSRRPGMRSSPRAHYRPVSAAVSRAARYRTTLIAQPHDSQRAALLPYLL